MLTTAFAKPKVMEIVLPDNKPIPPDQQTKVKDDRTINIVLDANHKVYWYNGIAKKSEPLPPLVASDFSKDGLRKMLLNRNKDLFQRIDNFNKELMLAKVQPPRDTIAARIRAIKRSDKTQLMVLIKPAEKVKYGDIVDVLDELAICNLPRYAIVDLTPMEKTMLETARKTNK
jgi:hypothetical protein